MRLVLERKGRAKRMVRCPGSADRSRIPAAADAGAGAAAAAPAQDVVVEVGNVPVARGEVLVALCTRETYLTPACPYGGRTPAEAGTTRVLVRGVRPGTYAVLAFQDLNGNGVLDRNLLGIPTEPFGFSNDARGRFGPPGFDAAAVKIPDRPVTIRLNLITG